MASVQDVAGLAFSVAGGCPEILEQLLCFLGGPFPRSPAVDQAAVFLLLVLPLAYVAGVIVAHFAGVVLAHLHPEPSTAVSFADLGRFVVMLFTLVSAWLFAVAVLLTLFCLVTGKLEIRPKFSWNVLS